MQSLPVLPFLAFIQMHGYHFDYCGCGATQRQAISGEITVAVDRVPVALAKRRNEAEEATPDNYSSAVISVAAGQERRRRLRLAGRRISVDSRLRGIAEQGNVSNLATRRVQLTWNQSSPIRASRPRSAPIFAEEPRRYPCF